MSFCCKNLFAPTKTRQNPLVELQVAHIYHSPRLGISQGPHEQRYETGAKVRVYGYGGLSSLSLPITMAYITYLMFTATKCSHENELLSRIGFPTKSRKDSWIENHKWEYMWSTRRNRPVARKKPQTAYLCESTWEANWLIWEPAHKACFVFFSVYSDSKSFTRCIFHTMGIHNHNPFYALWSDPLS